MPSHRKNNAGTPTNTRTVHGTLIQNVILDGTSQPSIMGVNAITQIAENKNNLEVEGEISQSSLSHAPGSQNGPIL
jgi:hypothetical protein